LVGTEHVWAVPRARPDLASPPVVHLLNRAYDAPTDRMIPQTQFTLRLRKDLFPDSQPARAVLHAPRAEPVVLDVRANDVYLEVTVPTLDLWGLLALEDEPS
jgi:hypothetical protein